MTNSNSKQIVFVPGCMMCPSFQADFSEKNRKWSKEIIPFLLEKDIGIIPMPCPEISFGGFKNGVARLPHGISYYEKLPGFIEYCEKLGHNTACQIIELSEAGFCVLAIIGIERSPTCAVSFLRTNRGTIKRQGLFMKDVSDELTRNSFNVPIIGINRSSRNGKFFEQINLLFKNNDKQRSRYG